MSKSTSGCVVKVSVAQILVLSVPSKIFSATGKNFRGNSNYLFPSLKLKKPLRCGIRKATLKVGHYFFRLNLGWFNIFRYKGEYSTYGFLCQIPLTPLCKRAHLLPACRQAGARNVLLCKAFSTEGLAQTSKR